MDLPSRSPIADSRIPDLAPLVPASLLSPARPALWDRAPRLLGGITLGRVWNSAWTLLVIGNLLWASNIIVGRVILGHVPSVALSFWRWTGAFLVASWFAWPYLKRTGRCCCGIGKSCWLWP